MKGIMTDKSKDVGILLVEDDEVDQMAMKRAFRQLQIENPLFIASDGVEALKCLHKMNGGDLQRPFIIVLDLNMPKMNGFEFMKEIRADEDLKNSVVFVLTTSSDDKDLRQAYNLNAAGYMVKSSLAGSFANAVDMMRHYWNVVELPA